MVDLDFEEGGESFRCEGCGTELPAFLDACPYCDGGEEDTTEPCASCGAEIYDDAEQCPVCGDWVVRRAAGGGGKTWAAILLIVLILALLALWVV